MQLELPSSGGAGHAVISRRRSASSPMSQLEAGWRSHLDPSYQRHVNAVLVRRS